MEDEFKKIEIIACYVMHYIFYSGKVNYIRERRYTKMTESKFPKDFLWGGAVAANQCEGAYLETVKDFHLLISFQQ